MDGKHGPVVRFGLVGVWLTDLFWLLVEGCQSVLPSLAERRGCGGLNMLRRSLWGWPQGAARVFTVSGEVGRGLRTFPAFMEEGAGCGVGLQSLWRGRQQATRVSTVSGGVGSELRASPEALEEHG